MKQGEIVLYLEAAGAAPEWIQILPLGTVELHDGREPFQVDRESLERVLQAHRKKQLDLVVDYEHQSLSGERAPAAGWIKELAVREDGLWARVEWTAAARQYLEQREYRYFSPVLRLEENNRRPRELLHVGLTNTPAIRGLTPLAAKGLTEARAAQAARSQKYGIEVKEGGHVSKPGEWAGVPDEEWGDPVNYRYPMPDAAQARAAWAYWSKPRNQEQYNEGERGKITQRIKGRAQKLGVAISDKEEAKAMLEKLKQLLQVKAEAGEAEILALAAEHRMAFAALTELAQVLELPDGAKPGEIKGAVLALKQGGEQLGKMQEELTQLKTERQEEKAQAAVEEALKAGKLQPSQRDWALDYARHDPAGFEAFTAKAPRIIPVGQKLAVVADDQRGTGGLMPEELAVCRSMNLCPEAFKAEKERLAKGTREE
jgi:phage I-like protein